MTDTLERLLDEGANEPEPRRRRKKKGSVGNIILTTLGVILLVAGISLGAGALFAPQAVEHAYGSVKTTVQDRVQKVQEEVFKEYPTVKLDGQGGMAELDAACGENAFVEMLSYERDGIPPVWAAHNNCGGDVILPWELGQQIQFEGDDGIYEIIDIKYTSKIWSTTADLVGLQGDIALQSCFYGEDRMKFIGLKKVGEQPQGE